LSEDFPVLAGFRPGSVLAGYRLEAQVGAGGMAAVFRARDERLGRLVALKILTPALAADRDFRRRFIAESRAAALVDDPHIIPVYEAGEADGVLFIAMRFVGGGDLRDVLDREGPLPPRRAAGFLSPVALALDAAHGAGLVHRDVKPANILVDSRPGRPDHVYLSDFGVSKGAMPSVSLTSPGQFLGTPHYSAPEQIQGQAVDGRTDQYALACVAYQLLTGQVPFERDQGMSVLLAHLSEPPPSLGHGPPGAADQVLARALAKVPEKRFGSCREFAEALRNALGVAPYDSGRSVSGPGRLPAGANGRSEFPVTSAAGAAQAVIPADLAVAVTLDSGAGELPRKPARQPTVGGDPGPPATDGPAGAGSISTANHAHASEPRPGSGRRAHARRPARGPARRWPIVTTSLVVLLAVLAVGGYVGWTQIQGQGYLTTDASRNVVIYRGIHEEIAGFRLYHFYQQTGIPLAQVPENYQQSVSEGNATGTLAGVQRTAANIRTAVDQCRQQYTARAQWVIADAMFLQAMARKDRPRNILAPGPEPGIEPMCPSPAAFGLPESALVPPTLGRS
jgi:tRNA A-37 threonylcarbamoyl transferase component Bud32